MVLTFCGLYFKICNIRHIYLMYFCIGILSLLLHRRNLVKPSKKFNSITWLLLNPFATPSLISEITLPYSKRRKVKALCVITSFSFSVTFSHLGWVLMRLLAGNASGHYIWSEWHKLWYKETVSYFSILLLPADPQMNQKNVSDVRKSLIMLEVGKLWKW